MTVPCSWAWELRLSVVAPGAHSIRQATAAFLRTTPGVAVNAARFRTYPDQGCIHPSSLVRRAFLTGSNYRRETGVLPPKGSVPLVHPAADTPLAASRGPSTGMMAPSSTSLSDRLGHIRRGKTVVVPQAGAGCDTERSRRACKQLPLGIHVDLESKTFERTAQPLRLDGSFPVPRVEALCGKSNAARLGRGKLRLREHPIPSSMIPLTATCTMLYRPRLDLAGRLFESRHSQFSCADRN